MFALLLCVCLNNTHRLSFQCNNPSLSRREGDVAVLHVGARSRSDAITCACFDPLTCQSCLLYAACVNRLPWHVESCFSLAVKWFFLPRIAFSVSISFLELRVQSEFGHRDVAWQMNDGKYVKTESFCHSEKKKKGEIDLQLAFNDQRMLDVWGPVGFVIALSQGCLVLGQVISMIGWYLGGLIDYPDSRVLQATFQSYVQMFSSPTFSECIESRPSCCFTACNHNKSMPAAHINIAPKSTAKLKGGEWIWDPVPLTRVRSMHAERAVDDPAAGREHSWNHLSAGQLWSGETQVFSGETCLEWSWHLILMAVVLQCFTSFLSTRWGSRRKAS